MSINWIPCSERNPRERGSYLVYRAGVDDYDICNYGTSRKWENGRDKLRAMEYRVTHWAELHPPENAEAELERRLEQKRAGERGQFG